MAGDDVRFVYVLKHIALEEGVRTDNACNMMLPPLHPVYDPGELLSLVVCSGIQCDYLTGSHSDVVLRNIQWHGNYMNVHCLGRPSAAVKIITTQDVGHRSLPVKSLCLPIARKLRPDVIPNKLC